MTLVDTADPSARRAMSARSGRPLASRYLDGLIHVWVALLEIAEAAEQADWRFPTKSEFIDGAKRGWFGNGD